MTAQKYRKKPVEIEAFQLSETNGHEILVEPTGDVAVSEAKQRSAQQLVASLPLHVPLISQQERERRAREDQLFRYLSGLQAGDTIERVARSYLNRTER